MSGGINHLKIKHSIFSRDGAALSIAFGAFVTFAAIFLPFLPESGERLGHDFSLGLPHLLSSYFWILNNGFTSLPWFSPSQCGGVPFFADLNVGYFTMPTLLLSFISPMAALRVTFLAFSFIGLTSTYALLRRRFRFTPEASLLGSVIFLFNGFFVYRFIIGHTSFHSFNLIPLAVFFLLKPCRKDGILSQLLSVCLAGLCFSYMFHSGMNNLLVASLVSCLGIVLIYFLIFDFSWRPLLIFGFSGLTALALSANKLNAALELMAQFPRDQYLLPGFASLGTLLSVLSGALFWQPSPTFGASLVNAQWALDRHEWEFGTSIISLFFLALLSLSLFLRVIKGATVFSLTKIVLFVFLMTVLCVPIVLNVYDPDLNLTLKSIPVIRNSSNNIRFFALYIPIIAVLTAFSFQLLFSQTNYTFISVACSFGAIILVISQNVLSDKDFYLSQSYSGAAIQSAYFNAKKDSLAVDIDAIISGVPAGLSGGNDAMVFGYSQLQCYQPLFGYRLESFPRKGLRPGKVFTPLGGSLNLKNPACYIFPRENACLPGDNFRLDQFNSAVAFSSYRPFPFETSERQKIATKLTNVVGVVALLVFLLSMLSLLRQMFLKVRNAKPC